MVDVLKLQCPQDHLIQFEKLVDDFKLSVQSLYQLLSTIEPLMISELMHNLKQTTLMLLNTTLDEKSPDTVVTEVYKLYVRMYLVDSNECKGLLLTCIHI